MKTPAARLAFAALLLASAASFAAAGALEDAASAAAFSLDGAAQGFQALLAAEEPSARQKLLDGKLRSAASSTNVAEIKRLVALGANPNANDGMNFTPLTTAVMSHGDVEVLKTLLALGAKVDLKGVCDVTALHYAASEGRLEAAKFLVANHAVVDAQACLGETPLVEAAEAGKLDVFMYLFGLGANPNAANYHKKTPLMFAIDQWVELDKNEMLKALLADRRTDANLRDEDGMTVLKLAVKGRKVDTIKLLLKIPGLNVNDNGGGMTALFLAELDRQDEIVKLLRAAGADGSLASR